MTRSILTRFVEILTAPLDRFDVAKTIHIDVEHDELLADLDPGWLEWRSSLAASRQRQSQAA